MTNLLKMCALGLLAFGLVACDEVSQKVNEVADSAGKAIDSATTEGKKIAQALSIEAPLLTIDFDEDYDPYFVIQSQDNNTIIEDIIINRGNCGVVKYVEDYDMSSAYRELNGGGYKLKTKNGQLVDMPSYILSMDFYNSLDADSKSVYKKKFPIKLSYAEKLIMKQNFLFRLEKNSVAVDCKANDIIEIEVIVNGGGSYIFKPKEMMLF